ncbi:uncharacterized protein [Palaemon carinicauda]|uniref:uncharacterized protein n=1 Tax=Palaemon carinicauda TaxID=392227 RepID=UPI0035B68103
MNPEDILKTDDEEHLRYLPIVVDHLKQNGQVVRCDKYTFGTNKVSFFLLAIAITLALLYTSLKGKVDDLKWSPPQEAAFCKAKIALSTNAALTFPVLHVPLLLSTDASNIAIWAVLEQVVNGSPHQLTFFSRELSQAEYEYSTFDRKFLAAY